MILSRLSYTTLSAVTIALISGATASAQSGIRPPGSGAAPPPTRPITAPALPVLVDAPHTHPSGQPIALPAVMPEHQPDHAAGGIVDMTPASLPGAYHGDLHGMPEHAHPAAHCEACEHLHHHLEDTHGQWFATGEYLLWRPRMDGLGYAIVDPVNDYTPTGRVRNLNHDVASGLRVGLGYRLPGHGWDVGVLYTYLSSSNDEAAVAPPGGVIYPTYTRPGVVDTVGRAVGFASFDYNVFDVDIGRTWAVDDHLTVRTFGGVRIAAIDMDYGANYDGIQALSSKVTNRLAFDGAGPTAGVSGQWNIARGFGLIGSTRAGLLYGDSTSRVVETNGPAPTQGVLTDVSDEFSGVAPFMSIALGGKYQWKNISFAAGYEVTHYFNLASQPVLVDDFAEGKYLRKRNDLSFDGVFFRLGVTY